MPDCYFIIEMNPKDPQQVYDDVVECARKHDGRRVRFSYDKKGLRAFALIAYGTEADAGRKLAALTRCLAGKKNKITESGVAQSARELRLRPNRAKGA